MKKTHTEAESSTHTTAVVHPAVEKDLNKIFVARERCWKDATGAKIVKDGSDDARTLLAKAEGDQLTAAQLDGLDNVGEFFRGLSTALED